MLEEYKQNLSGGMISICLTEMLTPHDDTFSITYNSFNHCLSKQIEKEMRELSI